MQFQLPFININILFFLSVIQLISLICIIHMKTLDLLQKKLNTMISLKIYINSYELQISYIDYEFNIASLVSVDSENENLKNRRNSLK